MENILLRLAYVAIETARTLAATDYVPQPDAMGEQRFQSFPVRHVEQRRIEYLTQQSPELVLGVAVILGLHQ